MGGQAVGAFDNSGEEGAAHATERMQKSVPRADGLWRQRFQFRASTK
jgi:hypothetical protein